MTMKKNTYPEYSGETTELSPFDHKLKVSNKEEAARFALIAVNAAVSQGINSTNRSQYLSTVLFI